MPTSVMRTSEQETATSGPGRVSSYRWVVLAAAVTSQTTASFVTQGVNVLIPFWQSAYRLTPATAALAASAVNIGPIATMLFLGWAIDRFGERRVVSSTMIGMGLTAFCAARLAPDYPVLLLLVALMGAFYASVQPGGMRAIVQWFPPRLRGMATGVRQGGLPLGGALAALILPALAVSGGWSASVCAQGGVVIAGGAVFAVLYREGLREAPGERKRETPRLRQLTVGLARDRAVRSVLIAGLAMVSFQYTFAAQILIFLRNHLGIPIISAGFVFAVAQGAGILGRVCLAWISDRLWPGRRLRSLQWVMLGAAVPLASLAFLSSGTPSWILLTICALLGLLGVGWYPLYLIEVAEMAPLHAVASTVSFAMTLNQVAIAAMPPIFGLIVGWSGYQAGWLFLLALMALAAVQLRRAQAAAPKN